MAADPQNHALETLLSNAWNSVLSHPEHRLRPAWRLELYNRLLGLADGTLQAQAAEKAAAATGTKRATERVKLPQTESTRRYYALGLKTVKHVLPIWQRDTERLIEVDAQYAAFDFMPHLLLQATKMLLRGETIAQVDELIEQEHGETVGSVGAFHTVVGNLSEVFWHSQAMVLGAAYSLFTAVHFSTLPITTKSSNIVLTEQSDDAMIAAAEQNDFAYQASEAFCTVDPNTPGWGQPFDRPIEQDVEKRKAFWQWWLFEAVPDAARMNENEIAALWQ